MAEGCGRGGEAGQCIISMGRVVSNPCIPNEKDNDMI